MNPTDAAGTDLAHRSGVRAGTTSTTLRHTIGGAGPREHVAAWNQSWPRALPMAVVAGGLLALAGFPWIRAAGVFSVYVAVGLMQLFAGDRLATGPRPWLVLAVGLVLQGFAMALTGGITSPLLPMPVMAAVLTFAVHGRSPASSVLIGVAVAVAVVLAVLPDAVTGPPIAAPYGALLRVWAFAFALFVARSAAYVLSDAHKKTGASRDRLRDDLLAAVTARAKSLESIGAKVAHELKNPLAAVKGLVQLLSRSAADERSQERLRVVSTEITRMEAILRDYLSFSRPLDALQIAPTDLTALCSDVFAVLEARAIHASVVVDLTGENVTVAADPRRLKEALLNLVANAIEATPEGGSVEVHVAETATGATITIRDTGKGMSAEALERIGTPFFTMRDGGTGLGVVLARAVVVQHGGELKFASEVGRGTTVTITLLAEPPAVGSAK